MVQALLSCFLSLVIGGVPCEKQIISRSFPSKDYAMNISTEEKEVGMTKVNGIIGRHEMVRINHYEYIGLQKIKDLSQMYNPNVFTGFKFNQTVTTITSNTVSTVEKQSISVTAGLRATVGMNGADVTADSSLNYVYDIEHSQTYTTSKSESISVEFQIREEILTDKKFCVCQAAYTFKLTCETWKWDDYWWGKQIVSGSRKFFTAYYTVEPFITIYLEDGTIYDT